MTMRALLAGFASMVLMAAFVVADDQKEGKAEVKLEGIKCVMKANAPAKAETGVTYKEGKVFFCCKGCDWEVQCREGCRGSQSPVGRDQAVHAGRLPVERREVRCRTETETGLLRDLFLLPELQG